MSICEDPALIDPWFILDGCQHVQTHVDGADVSMRGRITTLLKALVAAIRDDVEKSYSHKLLTYDPLKRAENEMWQIEIWQMTVLNSRSSLGSQLVTL